jgi:hypothetical protein
LCDVVVGKIYGIVVLYHCQHNDPW